MDKFLSIPEIVRKIREEAKKNNVFWIYGPDLAEHIQSVGNSIEEQVDFAKKRTAFNCPFDLCRDYLRTVQEAMRDKVNRVEVLSCDESYEVNYIPSPKHREVFSDMGDLAVERYLDKHNLPFDEVKVLVKEGQSHTAFIDIGVNAGNRSDTYVDEQHKKIYAMAANAEATRAPFRVIAAYSLVTGEGKFRFFIVLKDYDDPIFPNIWACIGNNASTNSLLNTISDFVIGTNDPGNGYTNECPIRKSDLGEEEEVVIVQAHTAKLYFDERG
jgi:hypothetical protein